MYQSGTTDAWDANLHPKRVFAHPSPGSALVDSIRLLTLEPGESDQAMFRALTLPNTIRTIQVHSAYAVAGEKQEHWNLLSGVDPGPDAKHSDQRRFRPSMVATAMA